MKYLLYVDSNGVIIFQYFSEEKKFTITTTQLVALTFDLKTESPANKQKKIKKHRNAHYWAS